MNNSKEGYKQTEIGVIPMDWEVKTLGDCLIKNPDYGINAAAVNYNDNLPTYLRITDISEDGKYINSNKVSVDNFQSDSYYLEDGDIVFARTGASVGKTYLYDKNDGRLVFAGFLIRAKSNPKILNSKYLLFSTQTKHYWSWVLANSMRSGQPGLNSNEYKSFQIALPPTLTEQSAIANALSDADGLITGLEKLIAKKRNIKQGAMQQLLQPAAGWEVKKLGEVCDFYNGKGHEQSISENGYYIVVNSKFVSTQGEIYKCSTENLFPLEKNDITIVMSDIPNGKALAKCFIIPEDNRYTLNQRIGAIRTNIVDYKFLYFILNRNDYYLAFDSGTGQTNLKKNDVLNCPLILPPTKEEQTRIASILTDMVAEISALEQKLEKYKKVKLGMMQELLTGKTRLV